MSSFFSMALIKRALTLLSEEDFTGKDIPYMHTKTIEYLIKQRFASAELILMRGLFRIIR